MNRLVWVDLETVGLSPSQGQILELGLKVTDESLRPIGEASWVVFLQDNHLLQMDDWGLEHHGRNGLLAEARKSEFGTQDVELMALRWLSLPQQAVEAKAHAMAGSSVHFDRAWLKVHMPELESWFHYRNVDVSTLKNLARLWYPNLPEFAKLEQEASEQHRALPDLADSIAELAYYRSQLFR